jgi:hypothetical protein
MSKLQAAMFAYPPGSRVTAQMASDQRFMTLLKQHEQCRAAFLQNPTPRLGSVLKQIEASIKYEKADRAKRGFA